MTYATEKPYPSSRKSFTGKRKPVRYWTSDDRAAHRVFKDKSAGFERRSYFANVDFDPTTEQTHDRSREPYTAQATTRIIWEQGGSGGEDQEEFFRESNVNQLHIQPEEIIYGEDQDELTNTDQRHMRPVEEATYITRDDEAEASSFHHPNSITQLPLTIDENDVALHDRNYHFIRPPGVL
ncbi:hypothetical protein LTS17_001239 [Exophiala oligosperma]